MTLAFVIKVTIGEFTFGNAVYNVWVSVGQKGCI